MNTANLQLQGLVMAVASLNRLLMERGLIDEASLSAALREAERVALAGHQADGLSAANREAIAFPIRLVENASRDGSAGKSFNDLAREVAAEGTDRT